MLLLLIYLGLFVIGFHGVRKVVLECESWEMSETAVILIGVGCVLLTSIGLVGVVICTEIVAPHPEFRQLFGK
jgi:hypothetical protein